jgi:hypothetical protein
VKLTSGHKIVGKLGDFPCDDFGMSDKRQMSRSWDHVQRVSGASLTDLAQLACVIFGNDRITIAHEHKQGGLDTGRFFGNVKMPKRFQALCHDGLIGCPALFHDESKTMPVRFSVAAEDAEKPILGWASAGTWK